MSELEFRAVSKRFGDFYANRNLNFHVKSGSIHGLVGENGAGKSTAMKTLFGIHELDEGEILLNDKTVKIKNPTHAMRMGIGMVHQHFMLADSETVLDNVILSHEEAGMILKRAHVKSELIEVAKNYGIAFEKWDHPVSDLSVGEQQRVEILKLLYQKSDILILDEPTAVLTPQEVKELFQNLKRLKDEGKTIILISHKLKEVLEFTDSVTVMRRGETVGTLDTKSTNEDELAKLMVGRDVSFTYQGHRQVLAKTANLKPFVQVLKLSIESKTEPLKNVSFELKPNEIVGVAGVQGNGQSTLLQFLANPKKFKGRVTGNYSIRNQSQMNSDYNHIRSKKVGLVAEDRLSEALLLDQNMVENFLLGQSDDRRYSSFGFLKRKVAKQVVQAKITEFDIRPTDPSVHLRRMSGGNQQKLVIARALDPAPDILYVAHPTRGVDVGAIEKIHDAIVHERNLGRSVLLFSSELDELIDLADRILVFYNGEIHAEFSRTEFDPWAIGRVMGGGTK